jgi:hypothetical protein
LYYNTTTGLQVYNGSAWVSAGSAGITGVTAGTGLTGGGTSGTVTVSLSTPVAVANGGTGVTTSTGTGSNVLSTDPTIATSLSIAGAALGTTAGNETIVENVRLTTSNVDYVKTKWRRLTAGADWQTAQAKIQRTVDVTDMGYVAFGGTSTQDVRIGSATTDIAVFAPTAITFNQPLSNPTLSGTVVASGIINMTATGGFGNLKDYQTLNLMGCI